MTKKILISHDPDETRVALIEDGVVVETYVERHASRSLLGNVYVARVDNVLPGMEAAFVDAGLAKNAFLYVDDLVIEGLDDRERRKKKIQDLIKAGEPLVVQVVKDPMGTKGARVTMELSLAGRFLVYMPEGGTHGVSKRLPEGERDRLRALVKDLVPKGGGSVIVRTAARGAERDELERDLALLEEQWAALKKRAKAAKPPALVHEEVDLVLEIVRDDLRIDVDELIVDDEQTYARVHAYVEQHSPNLLDRVKLHKAAAPLMRRYQVEDAIRSTLNRRVDLPSGGYLLFDYAEAFTIVDVNTGRFVGKTKLEDTILANNLEAAREVCRQLRLRDIGGMIIVDFIDMATQKNRDAVVACLEEELARDRSKVYLTSISPLGLVEITRQNVTDGVREVLTSTCPTCAGEGRVLSDESIAIENLRDLRRHARLASEEAFLVEVHPRIAALMVGAGGGRLRELEESTGRHFSIVGVDGTPLERCTVRRAGAVSDIVAEALPVEAGQELELTIAEPHMFQLADAVALLDGGYRVVVAGAGVYLGEAHRVRIDRVGRLEAFATLLDATPVTEEEMIASLGADSEVHEPERVPGERVDLEDRSRRRGSRRGTKAKADGNGEAKPASTRSRKAKAPAKAASDSTEEEAPAAVDDGDGPGPGEGRSRSARRRRRKRQTPVAGESAADAADGDVDADADGGDTDADEDDAESDVDGESAAKRRRGRRGGRRQRERLERAAARAGSTEAEAVVTVVDIEPPDEPEHDPDDLDGLSSEHRRSRKQGLIGRLLGRE